MRHRHHDMQHITTTCCRMILPFESLKDCVYKPLSSVVDHRIQSTQVSQFDKYEYSTDSGISGQATNPNPYQLVRESQNPSSRYAHAQLRSTQYIDK